jgi:choline dehydrogenase-like flavoprotein
VIVCCGAYGSPALLQRSGIGNGALLAPLGIDTAHHLPGVGENLQDHLVAPVQMKTDDPTSYGLSWRSLPAMIGHLARYAFRRQGLLASNLFEATGMVRSVPGLNAPDLQMIFMPAHRNASGYPIPIGHGFGILNVLLQPHSRGTVRIADARTDTAPLIDPRFLSDERDYQPLLRGIALSRQVLGGASFASADAHEIVPGPQVTADGDLRAHIRRSSVTVHHPVGTCKMGTDDQAVVDPRLRVHGLTGLRVVDASAMPLVVRGNTAAAIMMMAEKAADMIREDSQSR